jgi:putative flippase GtrA
MSPLEANFAGYALAVMVSFIGNARLTFNEGLGVGPFMRFLIVSLGGLALSQGLVYLLAQRLGLPFGIALLAITMAVPAYTFAMARVWVFRASQFTP